MNIADSVQETITGTSTSIVVLGGAGFGATLNNRSFADAVAAGAYAVGATLIPLRVEDDAGAWLTGAFTLTNATTLTRTAIGASSTAGADVTLAGTVRKVSVVPTALWARALAAADATAVTAIPDLTTWTVPAFDASGVPKRITLANLIAAMGVAPGGLAAAGAFSAADLATVNQSGIEYQTTLGALKTYFGATVAEVITVATPAAQTTGSAFTLSGTYANGTPAALDYSLDGGTTWQAAIGPTITGGNYSFGLTLSTANASQTINVRDHGSIGVIGSTGAFVVTGAAVQALTVNTPAAQAPNVPFNVTGTYANGTPTALDYSLDGGTTWVAATTPTIGSGNYSFNLTISSANAAQTVKVRDRTTLVTGTSGAFAVATPAQTIAVATPSAQVVGTPFNVTGTYANGTPTALDYRLSDDAAGVWTAVTTATIGSGAFSFSITPASVNAARTVSVRDRATLVAGTSGAYSVTAAPVQTITVNTPAAQVVGIAYTVSGTYANGTPAALDYSTDGGTTWTAATTPTIGSGTFSFSHTSTTASPTKVMKVRDHTNTSIIGTSGSYVVSATVYVLTGPPTTGAAFPATVTMTLSGAEYYASSNPAIYVKTAGNVAANAVKLAWGKSSTVAPCAYTDTIAAGAGAHTNSVNTAAKTGGWTTSGTSYYGLWGSSGSLYAWETSASHVAGTLWYLWVLTDDGFAKAYDNNTGTPVAWTLN